MARSLKKEVDERGFHIIEVEYLLPLVRASCHMTARSLKEEGWYNGPVSEKEVDERGVLTQPDTFTFDPGSHAHTH